MSISQNQVFEAMTVAIENAPAIMAMAFAAEDRPALYAALADRFDVTTAQAEAIGTFSFARMTREQREFIAEALAATPPDLPT